MGYEPATEINWIELNWEWKYFDFVCDYRAAFTGTIEANSEWYYKFAWDHCDFILYFISIFYVTCALLKSLLSSVLVLFRAAVSAIVSLAVLLTVYFVQLLSLFLQIEQNKDWLIDWYGHRRVCLSLQSSFFYYRNWHVNILYCIVLYCIVTYSSGHHRQSQWPVANTAACTRKGKGTSLQTPTVI